MEHLDKVGQISMHGAFVGAISSEGSLYSRRGERLHAVGGGIQFVPARSAQPTITQVMLLAISTNNMSYQVPVWRSSHGKKLRKHLALDASCCTSNLLTNLKSYRTTVQCNQPTKYRPRDVPYSLTSFQYTSLAKECHVLQLRIAGVTSFSFCAAHFSKINITTVIIG